MNSFFQDNKPLIDGLTGSPPIGRIVGGVYYSGTQTYANNDGVPFTFGADGKLLVDTELSLSGVEINNIKVFSTDNTTPNVVYGLADSDGVTYTNIAQIGSTATDVNAGNVSDGTLRTTLANDDPAVTSLAIMDDWDNAASDGASVSGDVAHDAADAGEPVKIGGKASTSKPTAVSNGDRVNAYFDEYGRLHMFDEGGGGVSGGGLTTYVFTPSNSFGHGTSAYASGTTFTVVGHSFSPEAVALIKVDRYNSSGVFQETLTPSQNTITASTSSGTTTYTYASGTFSAGDLFVVYQAGPERTTTLESDSQRVGIINRDTDKDVADILLDLTNITANTTAYGYIDMENFKFVSIQNETSDATPTDTLTLTLEATTQNDGTAAASCAYDDVTLELTGAASYVDTDTLWSIDVPVKYKYLRVKYVTSNTGGNDADLTTYVIKGV